MFDDPEVQAWLNRRKDELQALHVSAIVAALVTPNYLKDPQCMLQIGAAICMNKPIALMVFDDAELPPKLRGVADRVIRVRRDDPADMERAKDELAEFCEAQG